jgi:phenylpyruvate tautomerase PptA (4-oxalocrotonate tautomerase family)|tara:strand:+ start:178 stop:621 length:444 start_codon:yes stop_codon:yes gene_type:complete
MPTYTVTSSNFHLTSKQQKNLAEGITKVHNVVTGANTYFAQVIFNKTKKNNHFMGGKKVKEPSIFLLGQIRAGRTKNVKDKLISELKNILVKKSKLDETQVWVYINDLPPSQMIEYGAVLPESGKESEWFKNLSSKLKKKLSNIEKN